MRTTLWLSSVVVATVAWTMSGCGNAIRTDLGPYDQGSDPGSVTGGGDSSDGGGGGSSSSDGGASRGDGGSGGGSDGGSGSDSGTVATDAFTGAGPYVATLGPSTLKSGHTSQLGTSNPAGHNCLSCHGFAFGGTVYSTGTTPVSSAEVRVVDATGTAYTAYTDANGNFYYSASSGFTPPAKVGVRDGSNTSLMVGTINDGTCNGCHTGSSTARVHLP